jgi:hypothetical protein
MLASADTWTLMGGLASARGSLAGRTLSSGTLAPAGVAYLWGPAWWLVISPGCTPCSLLTGSMWHWWARGMFIGRSLAWPIGAAPSWSLVSVVV